jgi:hypothetical protein
MPGGKLMGDYEGSYVEQVKRKVGTAYEQEVFREHGEFLLAREEHIREAAFARGVAIGRAEGEAEQFTGELIESGPSDYEVWRDALQLAVSEGAHITDGTGDREGVKQFGSDVLLSRAEWFRNELDLGPRQVDVADVGDEPEGRHWFDNLTGIDACRVCGAGTDDPIHEI